MNKTITDGQAKDMILNFALSINEINDNFSYSSIKKHILPEKSIEDIKVLLQDIDNFEKETIKLKIGRNEVYLLSFGLAKSFLNNGGFEKIELTKNRTEQKEVFDFKVSKFKYHTFWWFFGFALIGFGLSIYNFRNNLSPSKNIIKQEERIEKMEAELEKLQTSILNQKNLDSLHNSKDLKNIGNKKE